MFGIFGTILMILGLFLVITATIGFSRFQNIYTQIHISTISDMLAFPLIILGIAMHLFNDGEYKLGIKLILAIILWYIVAPITNYAIIKIAYFYHRDEIIRNNSID